MQRLIQPQALQGLVSSWKFLSLRGWVVVLLQRYRVTAVQLEFLCGAAQAGQPVACTVRLVLSSWLLGLRSPLESASFLSVDLLIRRSPDRDSPWHRPGIRCCIGLVAASLLPLCSDSRQV